MIPNRGAWLEYESDQNDLFYVRIDKNRKMLITTFIRALGLETNAEIDEFFGYDDRIRATLDKDTTQNSAEALLEVYKKLRPGEPPTLESAKSHLDALLFDEHRYDISRVGRYKYNKKLSISDRLKGNVLAENIVDPETGELLAEAGERVTKQKAYEIEQAGVTEAFVIPEGAEDKKVKIISNGMVDAGPYLPMFDADELEKLGVNEKVKYKVLKEILDENGEDKDSIAAALEARVGELIPKTVTVDDIMASVSYLNCLAEDVGNIDDIDHLGNRRIRSVGELLQNQFRIG